MPGSHPVPPSGSSTVQIAEAAALDDITARAELVAGHWPGALPGHGGPIPAALPASAAALLHVAAGDVLQLRDRISGQRVRFVVTGLYRPRQALPPGSAVTSASGIAAGLLADPLPIDSETAKQIMRLLRTVVQSENVTALVAIHDPNLIGIANDVLHLEDGTIKTD